MATKECLDGELATAISSITATSQTATSYAKNELAKAKKEMKEGRESALKEIEATRDKALTAATDKNEKALEALEVSRNEIHATATAAILGHQKTAINAIKESRARALTGIDASRNDAIVTVTNKITNTEAYQDIADARKNAIEAIEKKRLLVMEDINAATPAPRAAVNAEAAAMLAEFWPQDASQPARQAISNIPMDPADPLLDQDLDTDGDTTDATTNNNASSTTTPSRDPPASAPRNWYTDPTILPRDESRPHYSHQHHYLTPQRMAMASRNRPNSALAQQTTALEPIKAEQAVLPNMDNSITGDRTPASSTVGLDPVSATVRFDEVRSTAVQRGPTGLPQPFQTQPATVLEVESDNDNARDEANPEDGAFDYHFTDCDDADFENAREEDIQRSIRNSRARPAARWEESNNDDIAQGSRLFPDARTPDDIHRRHQRRSSSPPSQHQTL